MHGGDRAAPGARGGVDVRGGGPGTRETDVIGPLAGTAEVTAVMLTGGSAFGLAAADGAMRWLEERGRGYATPGGLVPIVPAAVIYDLAEGTRRRDPDADAGYAACEAAAAGRPRARPGRRRDRGGGGQDRSAASARRRPGSATRRRAPGSGDTVAAIAVVNAFGDVIGADGAVLAGVRAADGGAASSTARDDRRDERAARLDAGSRSATRPSSA